MDMREYINIPLKLTGANTITQKVSGTKLVVQGANANTLTLGDATHEGGNLAIYRDGSGNTQLSVNADAAGNAKALDVYGGVVCQKHLTLGQAALNTAHALFVVGSSYFSASPQSGEGFKCVGTHGLYTFDNHAALHLNIPVTDSTGHSIKLRIDNSSIIEAKATGDGGGSVVNKAIGLYGVTPATQAAAIADPAETIGGNNAAIDAILVALRNIGLIAV